MKRKLQKVRSKLNVRNSEILIGLFILGKGLLLYKDSNYFIYPPQFKGIENSRLVVAVLVSLGLLLIMSAFLVPYVKKTKRKIQLIILSKVFLVLAGAVCVSLALLQLTHGIFTPFYRMGHQAWGDLIIFGFIYLTACDA